LSLALRPLARAQISSAFPRQFHRRFAAKNSAAFPAAILTPMQALFLLLECRAKGLFLASRREKARYLPFKGWRSRSRAPRRPAFVRLTRTFFCMPAKHRVAILGVGLIGGSIGLALRGRGLASEVIGIGRRSTSLEKALGRGAVDRVTTNLVDGVAGADWVIVATPVDVIVDNVLAAARAAPGAAITDAGSTKADICRSLRREAAKSELPAPLGARFVGSHPIAGDHRTGPEHARDDLFVGRTVVVTPTDETPPGLVERAHDFWKSLGASVELLSPEEHDRALAATSHLPHLVAAALAAATPEEWLRLAGSGWGDATRIAAGDPSLWRQIFGQNREAVIDSLRRFEHCLAALASALAGDDAAALAARLQEAKRIRDTFGK
jgi:prephenate dehydrogenase